MKIISGLIDLFKGKKDKKVEKIEKMEKVEKVEKRLPLPIPPVSKPIVVAKPEPTVVEYREPKAIERIIQTCAMAQDLDPILVKALVQTESSFIPDAYRYEPAFYKRYIFGKKKWIKHPDYHNPEKISASLGLTQLMCTTAIEYGFPFDAPTEQLYDPITNVTLGCKILKSKINKYGLELGILAYNSGSPKKGIEVTKQHNYVYLTKIAKHYKSFGGTNKTILKHAK